MAIYRNISLSFWEDNKIVDNFTPEDRYFYLYLLTNPHTNLVGCYEISLKQMSNETGYEKKKIEELIEKMENVHKVIFYSSETKEILLKNWSKYNWTRSEKLLKNVEKLAVHIKDEELKKKLQKIIENYKKTIGYIYPMHTSVAVAVSVSVNNNIKNILNNNNKLIELFNEYLQYRKDNNLSISKTVINDLLKFLKDYDDKEKEKIIKKAIKSGWKDFYPVNDKQTKKESVKYETV